MSFDDSKRVVMGRDMGVGSTLVEHSRSIVVADLGREFKVESVFRENFDHDIRDHDFFPCKIVAALRGECSRSAGW